MKKIWLLTTVLLLVIGCLFSCKETEDLAIPSDDTTSPLSDTNPSDPPASDSDFTEALQTEYTYTVENGEITITGYFGPGSHIVIPAEIDGYPVKHIGTEAFCHNATLKSVVFPETLQTIGMGSFGTCMGLSEITIPGNVKEIEQMAFCKSYSLKTVVLEEGIESIGSMAFTECPIESIHLPASLKEMGVVVFNNCTSLTEIIVAQDNPYFTAVNGVLYSKDMTELIQYPQGKDATTFVIPQGVQSINSQAFQYAELEEIHCPDSLTTISDTAFASCTALRTIHLGESLQIIDISAFRYCEALQEIHLPRTLTSIEFAAFEGCSQLQKVIFGGLASEWQEIFIDEGNEAILNSEIRFSEQ